MSGTRCPGKRRVYFNEFNVLMERAAYLPLVSGVLRAYAESQPAIAEHFEFQPFLFLRDKPEVIAAGHSGADVACFSTSMWNEQLNLRVSALVRARFPNCLIVFGGPQVPHKADAYLKEHPSIDVVVRGEGERPFAAILERSLESRDFGGIPNISWRRPQTGGCVYNEGEYAFEQDLDVFPSPYLEGLFDGLFDEYSEREFQAIVETNRGCPFRCAFCFWGQGGLSVKFRWHSMDRLRQEIEWCAEHRIRYVFNADSNFGMHRRDEEVAELLVSTKERFGYPEKFRACFGKNTDERIFSIGQKLHRHGMEKGITLSRQSMDAKVLENIDRKNIKMSTYRNLQKRFNESEVPVYTELILGLPGESHETWLSGIEEVLQGGLKNQLFIYPCQVYPNTTLSGRDYARRFGIRTRSIELTEIHAAFRARDGLSEYEDIIIESNTMPHEDWRRMMRFSWVAMALHSLKLGFFILMYAAGRYGTRHRDFIEYISEGRMPEGVAPLLCDELSFYDRVMDGIMAGRGRGCELPEFGALYWDVEEATVLRLAGRLDEFYRQFRGVLEAFLSERGIRFDAEELEQAFCYQRMRFPSWLPPATTQEEFTFNFPEYFECGFLGKPVTLEPARQTLILPSPREFGGDKIRFAREVILWGRKSDRLLEEVVWRGEPAGQPMEHTAAF